VLRWQLAPDLRAAAITAHSLAIRDGAGVAVAAIFMRGSSATRIVVRDVSLRLGHRTPAQCLELEIDSSLEGLTIIAPAGRDGSLVTFESDGKAADQAVVWSDAAGRHRVVAGPLAQIPQLPPGTYADACPVWWVESAVTQGVQLIAALPAAATRAGDEHVSADVPAHSGKMSVWANADGRWAAVGVEQPRRG
jgi:hypothetical protein